MASAYLGPESPRPLAVISEGYRSMVQDQLPKLPASERYDLGGEYHKQFFTLVHKYLELDTTDKLCYVGSSRDGVVHRLEEHFCLMEPVLTLVPGHVHYAETVGHRRLPIRICHVGVEEYFRQLVNGMGRACGPAIEDGQMRQVVLFDKILLNDACRYLTQPATLYRHMAQCLAPGGVLLIIHRPANLSTLPIFKDAHHRLADNDVDYMDIVRDLQNEHLDVQWELESVPVRMSKRKWLAMMRDRYPPQMEIMSDMEILGGLRELTEGILKYEGDQVEFKDRLLFIKATHSRLENGYPSIQRYCSSQFKPFPQLDGDMKLTLALPPDLMPSACTAHPVKESQFKFFWE